MIMFIDTEIVDVLSTKFNFPVDRIIYGQLDVARLYWIRYNEINKGRQVLPYMSFYRTIKFDENFRKAGKIQIIDENSNHRKVDSMQCKLNYVVEIIDGHNIAKGQGGIKGQTEYIKQFMMWNGQNPSISIGDDENYNFRVVAEDPEDNSDLELEEDGNGFIRTTFNFTVDGLWLDKSDSAGVITEILQRIHLYAGNSILDGTQLVVDKTIT